MPFVRGFGRVTQSRCCIITHMGGYTGTPKLLPRIIFEFLNMFLDDSLASPSILTFVDFLFSFLLPFFFSPLSKHGHICQPCDLLACLTVLTHQVKFHVTNCFPSVVTLCFTPGYFRVSSWFKHTHTHTHTPRLFFFNYFIPVTHYCHLLAVVTHLLRRR